MPTTTYQYRPLDDNQIRVLTANDASHNSSSFHHVTLDEHQTYNAVSYAWGPSTLGPLPFITIDGCIVEAGANAFEALSSATRLQSGVPVWIDAICINQQDPYEKAKQIPLMGKVYSQASSVLIVLTFPPPAEMAFPGSHENELDLSGIIRDMSGMESGGMESHMQLDRPVTPLMGRTMFLVNEMLTQTWWNRLWTFQEYALAKNPVFLYGNSRIENETLVRYVELYRSLNLAEAEAFVTPAAFRGRYRSNKHKSRDQPSGEEQDATTILLSLQEHRERLARGKEAGGDANMAFDADMDVLASTFRRDASHACDKIFGLLGVLQSAPLRASLRGLAAPSVRSLRRSAIAY
jgi:hypothetical protein